MDRRQRKTREAIFGAFSELLQHKRYESITVQDIIDEADVGRSTFYSHFETKDALLKALCSEIFEHIFKGDLCDYPGKTVSLEEKLAHILWHVKNYKKDITGLLSCESADIFMFHMKGYLSELFSMHIGEFHKDVPEKLLMNHLINSFCAIIKWCCENKSDFSPEDLARYYIKLVI